MRGVHKVIPDESFYILSYCFVCREEGAVSPDPTLCEENAAVDHCEVHWHHRTYLSLRDR